MAYPGTIDSYTPVQGTTLLASVDHAGQHNQAGSAVVALETVLGTTAGTSVVKNFAAGDFAARINSGGTLQQIISGTINNATLGTAVLTAPTIQSLADNTTGDVSTSAHGFAPKAPNDTTKFLRGDATWSVPSAGAGFASGCSVTGTADQTIAASTDTKIQFNTEIYDLGSEFDNATNYRFTATTTGKYLVTASAFLDSFVAGKEVKLYVKKNGAIYRSAYRQQGTNETECIIQFSGIIDLSATDYIEFFVNHNDTTSRTLFMNGQTQWTYAMVQRLY